MWTRRCTRERTFALVMISSFGSFRNARISGVIDDQLVAAAQHVHVAARAGCRARCRRPAPAALVAGERVVAHAEEGEIVGDQPFQELDRLGDLVDRQRRRIVLELGDQLADAREHRPPVLHAERARRRAPASIASTISVAPRLVLDALDMDVDEALAPRRADGRAVAAEADQRAGVVALDA